VALTRAQLLAGNTAQGTVLAGQVQGVTQGAGISISANGTISVDASTVVGLMKLNSGSAYNAYVWPGTAGSVGQQLRTDGAGNLSWFDPDSIPWTDKGELVVGTGTNTEALLKAGANGSILVADNTTATGLAYTANYVSTTGPTGAAILPAGGTGDRPGTPVAGQIRYNSDDSDLEFYDGSSWIAVPDTGGGNFGLGLNVVGNLVRTAVPIQFGPPAVGTQPSEAVVGSTYWDDNLGAMFIYYDDGDSAQWVQVLPS
jgi:hypothetical protein